MSVRGSMLSEFCGGTEGDYYFLLAATRLPNTVGIDKDAMVVVRGISDEARGIRNNTSYMRNKSHSLPRCDGNGRAGAMSESSATYMQVSTCQRQAPTGLCR